MRAKEQQRNVSQAEFTGKRKESSSQLLTQGQTEEESLGDECSLCFQTINQPLRMAVREVIPHRN